MTCRYRTTALTLALGLMLAACQDDDASVPIVPPSTDADAVPDPLVDSASIDARVNAFLDNNPVAGMSVAIVRTDGEPLTWTGHYGVRDVETGAPVDEETSFWLGSVSKLVMGTAMMIARERGFLDLDDDVRALLAANGGFSIDGPSMEPITLAQLASHTSGIVDADTYLCAYWFVDADGRPSGDFVDADGDPLVDVDCPDPIAASLDGFLGSYLDGTGALYDIDENFGSAEPGTEEEYSNIGAALAGHAIGLATGQDLATWADQEIFTPLGMSRTSWRSADLDAADIATPYFDLGDGPFALPKYELATWPDGGLRSNAADLAALLGALMRDRRSDGSTSLLLSAESIEMMLPAADAEYGLFVEGDFEPVAGEGQRVLGHSGSDPGAFSFLLFDPETDIGVTLTANGDDDEVDEAALEALLAALFEGGAAMGARPGRRWRKHPDAASAADSRSGSVNRTDVDGLSRAHAHAAVRVARPGRPRRREGRGAGHRRR